jgi:hypothetical protein
LQVRPKPTLMYQLSVFPFYGRLLSLTTSVRLG